MEPLPAALKCMHVTLATNVDEMWVILSGRSSCFRSVHLRSPDVSSDLDGCVHAMNTLFVEHS